MESLLPKDENQKVKYFTNLGLVYVPISTFENAVAVWDVISSNEEKVLLAYSAVEILTFGPSLVSANGYAWKHPRAVLTKAFRKEAMLNVQTVIRKLTDELISKWQGQKIGITVLPDMIRVSFETILEFTFGKRFSCSHVDECLKLIEYLLAFSWKLTEFPITTTCRMLNPFGEFAHKNKRYRSIMMDAIQEARSNPPSDLYAIRLMLDEGWTNEEILPQVCIFLFAGHDTTASATTSALNELLSNPDLIASVQNDDAQNHYCLSVFREALRLWPPVFSTTVQSFEKDIVLPDGVVLPKGCIPMPWIGPLHRSELNFKDPLKFDPSRPVGSGIAVPFSKGPRNCIGSSLALVEGPIIIKEVFSRLKLTRIAEPKFTWMQTWKPEGLIVNVEELP